jgi:hypothetical protein
MREQVEFLGEHRDGVTLEAMLCCSVLPRTKRRQRIALAALKTESLPASIRKVLVKRTGPSRL